MPDGMPNAAGYSMNWGPALEHVETCAKCKRAGGDQAEIDDLCPEGRALTSDAVRRMSLYYATQTPAERTESVKALRTYMDDVEDKAMRRTLRAQRRGGRRRSRR